MSNTQIVYVFLMQRPRDAQAWPVVYTNEQLAEQAFGRVSPVISVAIPYNKPTQGIEKTN